MLTGISALESTDWPRRIHAYGRALDTPGHLRALLAEDAKGRREAMAQVALVLAGFMDDPRLDQGELPVRAELTLFLTRVVGALPWATATEEQLERDLRMPLLIS